jgi:hypothetical protein
MTDVLVPIEGTRYDEGSLEIPVPDAELLRHVDAGRIVVLKRAFAPEAMERIRAACVAYGRTHESSNPDLQPGVPNFYRIDNDPPKSQVKRICRSFSTFYWNDGDFGGERPYMLALARLRNRLAGLEESFAATRIEDEHLSIPTIVHYPVGGGYLQAHEDPPGKQRAVVTAILSQLGSDYGSGGLYADDPEGRRVMLDADLEVGDVYLLNPAVRHGVAPVDPDEPLELDSERGRWMMFSALVPFASLSGQATEGLRAYPAEQPARAG